MRDQDLYNWESLTAMVNEIVPPETLILDLLFKDVPADPTDIANLDFVTARRAVAPFVAPGAPARPVSKTARGMRRFQYPRIYIEQYFTAQELQALRPPADTNYFITSGSDPVQAGLDKLALEQANMLNTIVRRKELMAASLLMDGTLAYDNSGVDWALDINVPTACQEALAGNFVWGGSTDDILNDIRTGIKQVNKSGYRADIAFAGELAVKQILADTAIQSYLDNRRMRVGDIELSNSAYVGNIAGVDIYEVSETYETDADVETDMFTGDMFVIASRAARFEVKYGAVYNTKIPNIALPLFSNMLFDEDGKGAKLLMESLPLPLPMNPNALYQLDTGAT